MQGEANAVATTEAGTSSPPHSLIQCLLCGGVAVLKEVLDGMQTKRQCACMCVFETRRAVAGL